MVVSDLGAAALAPLLVGGVVEAIVMRLVDKGDQHRQCVADGAQLLLAVAHSFLGSIQVGGIGGAAHQADDASGLIENRLDVREIVQPLAAVLEHHGQPLAAPGHENRSTASANSG